MNVSVVRTAICVLSAGSMLVAGCTAASTAAVGSSLASSASTLSSASLPSTGPADPTTQTSTAQNSTAQNSTADNSQSSGAVSTGTDLAARACTGIKIADAQALVKSTVTKIDFDPGSAELDPQHQFVCQFNDQIMMITVDPEDANQSVYKEEVSENAAETEKPLAGVGDKAEYAGVVLSGVMTAPPTVIAHKGSVTCEVDTGGGKDLTIAIDPGPVGGSTLPVSLAYAGRMGALCNDIFAGLG